MQESEFSLEINIDNWEPDPHGVFVIYEWEWVDRMPSEPELTSKLCDDFSIPSQQSCSSSPLSCDILATSPNIPTITHIPIITHIVIFKCIGAVRDGNQQRALEEAYIAREKGETVDVKIEPEPMNPYDSKAICFKCHVGGLWCRISYVVREVLDEVHEAIRAKQILWTRVKFLLHWTRSGPGFYAGISIARKGEWSQKCVRAASTK